MTKLFLITSQPAANLIHIETWFKKSRVLMEVLDNVYKETTISRLDLALTHSPIVEFSVHKEDVLDIDRFLSKVYFDFQYDTLGVSSCSFALDASIINPNESKMFNYPTLKGITQQKMGIMANGYRDVTHGSFFDGDIVLIENSGFCAINDGWIHFNVVEKVPCEKGE